MNVTEAINARHSIRAFLPKPVKREKLDAVPA
jgi:nitroreductase